MVDLHIHSHFSDGTFSPTELVLQAEKLGLSAAALCDHNTTAGLSEFTQAAEGKSVEAVAGIEFSADYGSREVHILALFLPREHWSAAEKLAQDMLARKDDSNMALVRALEREGIKLDYHKIKSETAGGIVNRAVIAAEMTKLGYAASVKDAFDRWLKPERGYFKPPKRLDCFEAIGFIRDAGAVSVLAHPFLNLQEAEARAFLPQAKEAGLNAMETLYPKFDEKATALAKKLCARFGLEESGGSDFHGANKPDIRMGVIRDGVFVPRDVLLRLRRCVPGSL